MGGICSVQEFSRSLGFCSVVGYHLCARFTSIESDFVVEVASSIRVSDGQVLLFRAHLLPITGDRRLTIVAHIFLILNPSREWNKMIGSEWGSAVATGAPRFERNPATASRAAAKCSRARHRARGPDVGLLCKATPPRDHFFFPLAFDYPTAMFCNSREKTPARAFEATFELSIAKCSRPP